MQRPWAMTASPTSKGSARPLPSLRYFAHMPSTNRAGPRALAYETVLREVLKPLSCRSWAAIRVGVSSGCSWHSATTLRIHGSNSGGTPRRVLAAAAESALTPAMSPAIRTRATTGSANTTRTAPDTTFSESPFRLARSPVDPLAQFCGVPDQRTVRWPRVSSADQWRYSP